MAQVDMLKKVLSQEETDLHSLSLRVHDVHHAIDGQQKSLDELDARQQEQRAAHETQRAEIEAELAAARAVRDERASHVSKTILLKYERILSRNTSNVLYPLRGQACGTMRHRDSDAAAERDCGGTRDQCVRGVWSASVRGGMMLVAPHRGG